MAEKPEDFNLPNAIVGRIVKDALPDGVSVSKEARVALSKAASIFVLYATSSANNFAQQSNRKTLTSQDVFAALEDLEFGEFIDPLKETLEGFRQEKARKLSNKKVKADKENPDASLGESMENEVMIIDEEEEEEEEEIEEVQEENCE